MKVINSIYYYDDFEIKAKKISRADTSKEYFYKDLNNTNINICKLIKKYTKVPIKKRLENNVYTIKEKTKINIKKAMKL